MTIVCLSFAGAKVFVDSKAIYALKGTQMDYVDDKLKCEFTFENPNIKGRCGCGESFHVHDVPS